MADEYCKGYIGVACIDGSCPNAQEDSPKIECSNCWYYRGCEDCATPEIVLSNVYGCPVAQQQSGDIGR